MENNSVAFTSKIIFVDRKAYNALKKCNYIYFYHDKPNILKANEFYSEGIRTCTGGGLINPHIEAEGFHLWDDKTNTKKFPEIVNSLFRFVKKPQRGLLVGSKKLDDAPYSIPQFAKLKEALSQRVKKLTLFQQHKFANSETHYHYSLENDTWTLDRKSVV